MFNFLILAIGLAVLLIGGDILVRGAVDIAKRLSIPPLLIGLTIVSIGTSAPELFISVQAALAGSGGLAIGNVLGSNIANVLLVLGVPALMRATDCREAGLGRNIHILIGITVIFMVMLAKGQMGFIDGLVLLAILALFLHDQFLATPNAGETRETEANTSKKPAYLYLSIMSFTGGIILLPLGALLTVNSARSIATLMEVSDEVIGLTIVAVGTSLPELAASVMAVYRGNSNVALGNVIGSNIFNIAAIMGITLTLANVKVGHHVIAYDMWIMLGVSVFLAWLAWRKGRISRRSGIIMTSLYIIYLATAFIVK